MNQKLHTILTLVEESGQLTDEEKIVIKKSVIEANEELEKTTLELESTEKAKRTTVILLEETIKELAQKDVVVAMQKRELEIEAALEKVRSRTMAMHKSEELRNVVSTVVEQLTDIGLRIASANIILLDEHSKDLVVWTKTDKDDTYFKGFNIPYNDDPAAADFFSPFGRRASIYTKSYTFEEKNALWENIFERSDYRHVPADRKKFILEARDFSLSLACRKNTAIQLTRYIKEPFSETDNEVLQRFANVFEQTYTRFLDLQKAEAQAREAQIEVALEKVRSRSLAMHKSDELQEVVNTVFDRLKELAVEADAAVIYIAREGTPELDCWLQTAEQTYSSGFPFPYFDQSVLARAILASTPGFITKTYSKEDKNEWFDLMFKHSEMRVISKARKRFILNSESFTMSRVQMKHTGITMSRYSSKSFTAAEYDILTRFARVFEQAYTRFRDLQKAEAQAREAIKQASLDRVRGEIASMRSAADLQRIIPLVWDELKLLGVPFIRCGVFIVHETEGVSEVYLSTPNGLSLGVFRLSLSFNEFTTKWVAAWRKGKVYRRHWDRQDFVNWTKSMIELGQVQSQETYQGASEPPEKLDLNLIPFKQGMLYVGNTAALDKDEVGLVRSLAKAFEIAYARYEDFSALEKAKQHVESTLTKLKSTQAQLIQSEKMASLGELTAGIAHEIQNPLNFVNNYSELNTELIDDMKAEIDKGNFGEVRALVEDLAENERKIMQNGKRAESIVRGMLEHSRTRTGTKEPTSLNALADEYLRLAYYGMKAKDSSFQAEYGTDLDESLPLVPVVPQGIGRVLLNILSNAFQAVHEKRQQVPEGYQPLVKVTTQKVAGAIEIRIQDNGNGIPDSILDKIFQPFFTTRPTGQGTGLGLSLAYDVVKAHGGTITVASELDSFTTFTVSLPVS